jgi:hypothetical protein
MRAVMMAAAAIAAVAGGAVQAQAQDVVHWDAPSTPVGGQYTYFPSGTPLRLATRTELSTRENHAGDRVYLQVAEPLVYRGQTVVPVGAMAVGEVIRVERSAAAGKRGEMAVRLLYVQTPVGPVRLSGRIDRAGNNQQVLAIGGATFVAWPMIFIHGTSARLPADSPVLAYLADDLRFALAAPTTLAANDGVRVLPEQFDAAAFGGVRP